MISTYTKKNALIILIAIVIMLLSNSVFIVKEGEGAVVYVFGEARKEIVEKGPHFRLPIIGDHQIIDMKGVILDTDERDSLTKAKDKITTDGYALMHVQHPMKFVLKTSDGKIATGLRRLDETAYSVFQRVIATNTFEQTVSTKREGVMREIQTDIADAAGEFGMNVTLAGMNVVSVPKESWELLFGQMISEREKVAAGIISEGVEAAKKITSHANLTVSELLTDAEREGKEIMAAADKEAGDLYNTAYNADKDFYVFYQGLDTAKQIFDGRNNDSKFFLSGNEVFLKELLSSE